MNAQQLKDTLAAGLREIEARLQKARAEVDGLEISLQRQLGAINACDLLLQAEAEESQKLADFEKATGAAEEAEIKQKRHAETKERVAAMDWKAEAQ